MLSMFGSLFPKKKDLTNVNQVHLYFLRSNAQTA